MKFSSTPNTSVHQVLQLPISKSTPGFELSVSQSGNAIYFSIIAIPKKSHFTIFTVQNFVQNTKKHM